MYLLFIYLKIRITCIWFNGFGSIPFYTVNRKTHQMFLSHLLQKTDTFNTQMPRAVFS